MKDSKHNYRKGVKDAIVDYINKKYDAEDITEKLGDRFGWENELYDHFSNLLGEATVEAIDEIEEAVIFKA